MGFYEPAAYGTARHGEVPGDAAVAYDAESGARDPAAGCGKPAMSRRPRVLGPVAALLLGVLLGAAPTVPTVPAVPAATVAEAGPPAQPSPDPIAHDPTLIRQGRYYYEIITGDIETRTYLPIRRSTDLVHWTFLGTVFTTPPEWVVDELGVTPGDFWAPDITYFDGEYHLYYAASSFGTNNSVIGLATNATLDPDSPDYRWVDRGMVLRSRTSDNFNAIDADVTFNEDGVPWLSFGSFWDGIKMRRLDASTGLLSTEDTTLYSLASRGGAAVEGPSIVRKGRYWYLFASFDFCCRGVNSDYRVVVGRSTSLHGPYVDRDGVPLLQGGGTELLRGYNGFQGTGGGDVLLRPDKGPDLYVHHYYDADDGALPKGSVRPISWEGGWPRLGDPLSGNRGHGRGPAYVTLVSRDGADSVDNPTCGYEGADIRLTAPETGDACRQWRLEYRGGGWSSILNRHSNKVAEVAACANADGARVAQWGWLDNDCQKFRFLPTDHGWSRIENKLAGRVLDACDRPDGAVQTFTWRGEACQQFRLQPVGDLLITDPANRKRLGDTWRFVHIDEGYYLIVDSRTGHPLGGRGSAWCIEVTDVGTYRLVARDGGTTQEVLLMTPH
ncbi:family 43 glycosylhydrolase [Nonomuraea turcica]|uniref:family 43 glycosylhydrolase n=1 Tax=Nonomuraea sp. G32 TaxID=3067274 RepID=UPI00273B325D|nr:family 43 glycosylhydrolase [Nonomuraea sp. G32]MDP4502001.1 family 43 glycosylhydrolase [Nonomuraea sp. G32]